MVKPPSVFTAARIPVIVPGRVFWVENENGVSGDEPVAELPANAVPVSANEIVTWPGAV